MSNVIYSACIFFAKNFFLELTNNIFLELTNNSFITLRCFISEFEKNQACHGKQ
jgi:hypothetical protein